MRNDLFVDNPAKPSVDEVLRVLLGEAEQFTNHLEPRDDRDKRYLCDVVIATLYAFTKRFTDSFKILDVLSEVWNVGHEWLHRIHRHYRILADTGPEQPTNRIWIYAAVVLVIKRTSNFFFRLPAQLLTFLALSNYAPGGRQSVKDLQFHVLPLVPVGLFGLAVHGSYGHVGKHDCSPATSRRNPFSKALLARWPAKSGPRALSPIHANQKNADQQNACEQGKVVCACDLLNSLVKSFHISPVRNASPSYRGTGASS